MIKRQEWAMVILPINANNLKTCMDDIHKMVHRQLDYGFKFHGPSKMLPLSPGVFQYAQEFVRDIYG